MTKPIDIDQVNWFDWAGAEHVPLDQRDERVQEILQNPPKKGDYHFRLCGENFVLVTNTKEDGIEVYDCKLLRKGWVEKKR